MRPVRTDHERHTRTAQVPSPPNQALVAPREARNLGSGHKPMKLVAVTQWVRTARAQVPPDQSPSAGQKRTCTHSSLVILTCVSRPSRRRGQADSRGGNGPRNRLRAPGWGRWPAVTVLCPQAGCSPPLPGAAGHAAVSGHPPSTAVGGAVRGVHRTVGGAGTTPSCPVCQRAHRHGQPGEQGRESPWAGPGMQTVGPPSRALAIPVPAAMPEGTWALAVLWYPGALPPTRGSPSLRGAGVAVRAESS